MELSKRNKKAAREIIEIGLLRELEEGVQKVEAIIAGWQKDKSDSKATYYKLFEAVTSHDKHIAMRYDRISGSRYLDVIMGQLADGVIHEDELKLLSEDVQQYILSIREHLKRA